MKRKFINGFLMLALMVTAVGSFVSCKDYDDDMYVDLRGRITKESTLREALEAQVNELDKLVKSIKSCTCEMKDWLTKADLADYVTKAELNAAIKILEDRLNAIESKLPQIDKNTESINKLTSDMNDLNVLILSVKATADEALELAKKNKCECDLTPLEERVSKLETLVVEWNKKLTEVNKVAQEALTLAKVDSARIDENRVLIDSLFNELKKIAIEGVQGPKGDTGEQGPKGDTGSPGSPGAPGSDGKDGKSAYDLAVEKGYTGTLEEWLASLKGDNGTNGTNGTNGKDGKSAYDLAVENGFTGTLAEWLESLKGKDGADGSDGQSGQGIDTEQLAQMLNDYVTRQELKDSLKNYLKYAKDYADQAADAAKEAAIQALKDSMINVNTKIVNLQEQIDKCVTKTEFKETIDKLEKNIKDLNTSITKIMSGLKAEVSGLIIQGTDCPLLGYLNLPLDVRSTLLVAYYGESDMPTYKFPSKWTPDDNPSFFVDPNEAFTERQLNIIGDFEQFEMKSGVKFTAGGFGADANAGTLYVTVNPNNVDMTGKTLELVTSNGKAENSNVSLSPLQKYDGTLKFGYTRAGNNLYSTNATIKYADLEKAAVTINANEVIDAVGNKSIGSLATAALAVLRSVNNKVPACGVKYSWYDTALEQNRSVYSQYDIAATTFKPLSFNVLHKAFEKEKSSKKIKNAIYSVVAKVTAKIKPHLPPGVEFEDIEYRTDDYNNFIYTFPDGTSTILTVDFTDEETIAMKHLIDDINKRYGANSPVNDFMKAYIKVYKYLDKENYQNVIEKFYSYFLYSEHLFDVALIIKQEGGSMGLAWPSVNIPSWMPKVKAGTVSFIPTSYSLELFAPAFKKFVAITDVLEYKVDASGNRTVTSLPEAEAKAEADAASGSNMKKVISGITQVSMTGKKNYMYEISYAAVDYRGLSHCNQFYVLFE